MLSTDQEMETNITQNITMNKQINMKRKRRKLYNLKFTFISFQERPTSPQNNLIPIHYVTNVFTTGDENALFFCRGYYPRNEPQSNNLPTPPPLPHPLTHTPIQLHFVSITSPFCSQLEIQIAFPFSALDIARGMKHKVTIF